MKKQHLIILTAGVLLVVIILANKNKGNDVSGLQSAFSNLTGAKISNQGAYDNNTLQMVQSLLKGSNALVDYDKGYVDRKFASDLFLIQYNAKQSIV